MKTEIIDVLSVERGNNEMRLYLEFGILSLPLDKVDAGFYGFKKGRISGIVAERVGDQNVINYSGIMFRGNIVYPVSKS